MVIINIILEQRVEQSWNQKGIFHFSFQLWDGYQKLCSAVAASATGIVDPPEVALLTVERKSVLTVCPGPSLYLGHDSCYS